MGKLIVIEGIDGSGKSTQIARLFDYLKHTDKPTKKIAFPDYRSYSADLVRAYLMGHIDPDPMQVNPYAAASFYACDRYISYKNNWSSSYKSGDIILCDRYASSNAIHQMVKLPQKDWKAFLDWVSDYEYARLLLPKPDLVLFLDVPPNTSIDAVKNRGEWEDIHENIEYQKKCYKAAKFSAREQGWEVIKCTDGKNRLTIDNIHDRIIKLLQDKKII